MATAADRISLPRSAAARGEGTNTACFGEALPNVRGNKAARVGPDGTLQVPSGTKLPSGPVPFDR